MNPAEFYTLWGPRLFDATLTTMSISAVAFLVAVLVGMPLAAMLRAKNRLMYESSKFAILALRGLPDLVALYLLYYGLRSQGLGMTPFLASVLGLGLIQAAFVAEIYRSSLRTIAKGQYEAGAAIGLSRWTRWRLVIAPEALWFSLPPLINIFVALLKLSVVASAIGVAEILYISSAIMNQYYVVTSVALGVTVIFFAITLPLTWLGRRLESAVRAGQAGS